MNLVTFDTKEFDQALVEYAAASGKDFAEACNRQMKNLAVHGIKTQKEAQASAIQKLESMAWWPKYVARLLHGRKVTAARAKFWASKSRSMSKLARASHYTVDQARIFSKKVIRKRLVAVKFLKFFFLSLARAAGGSAPGGKTFAGFDVQILPATESNPMTLFRVAYEYKNRSAKTARKAVALLQASLNSAMSATAADMMKYVERKMSERARQYSARGAK